MTFSIEGDFPLEEFESLGPWISSFECGGRTIGGDADLINDWRIQLFKETFPDVRTVLELGSLEGSHSISMAQVPKIERIVSLELRDYSIEKASFMSRFFKNTEKIDFIQADLEEEELDKFGRFDCVLCIGVLYHMKDPRRLVEKIAGITDRCFIWTHFCEEEKADSTLGNYRGRWWEEGDWSDPLSGAKDRSFWMTKDSILDLLKGKGFEDVEVLREGPHRWGPVLTLRCGK